MDRGRGGRAQGLALKAQPVKGAGIGLAPRIDRVGAWDKDRSDLSSFRTNAAARDRYEGARDDGACNDHGSGSRWIRAATHPVMHAKAVRVEHALLPI